jgi:hypothetical protein
MEADFANAHSYEVTAFWKTARSSDRRPANGDRCYRIAALSASTQNARIVLGSNLSHCRRAVDHPSENARMATLRRNSRWSSDRSSISNLLSPNSIRVHSGNHRVWIICLAAARSWSLPIRSDYAEHNPAHPAESRSLDHRMASFSPGVAGNRSRTGRYGTLATNEKSVKDILQDGSAVYVKARYTFFHCSRTACHVYFSVSARAFSASRAASAGSRSTRITFAASAFSSPTGESNPVRSCSTR